MKQRNSAGYCSTKKTLSISKLIVSLLIMFSFGIQTYAQNETNKVSGVITDEKGQPLAGVTVTSSSSKKAVVTNEKGEYTIPVKKGAKLILTSTGYLMQEVPVTDAGEMRVTLKEDVKVLDEVSIGYQKLRKSDLTGAVTSIKAKELNLTTPTLSQALVGKAAGVQVSQVSGAPYAGAKIRVRGIGSINASSEPLYVIDGYPMGGNVSSGPGNSTNSTNGYNPASSGNDIFINPDDIESIEILKDAASAAIYGSRASAGVVLITTKRGKTGKGKFEFDYQYGANSLAKKVKLLDAQQFAQLFVDGRNNAYHDIMVAKGVAWNDSFYSDDNATRVAKAGSANTASIAILKSLYDFQSQKVLTPQYNTDWQDALYRTAANQRFNLSFSGGSPNTRYLMSLGYQDQDGIITSTFQKRINFRANIDGDITKKLRFGSSVFVTSNNNREVEEGRFDHGPILGALVMMPFFSEFNPDGSLQLGKASEQTDGYSYGFQTIENPVALAQRVKITRVGTRATANANASYDIAPGLTAKISLGGQLYTEKYEYYYPTNLSSGVNPPGSPAAVAAANASALNLNTQDLLAEYTLNYKKQIGKSQFGALAGYTAQKTTLDQLSVGANGFTNDNVKEITARGANAANFYINSNATFKSTTTLVSYLARVIYAYDQKYYVTGSFRTDASSRFGPENRWGQFPSVSLGWNMSNESFYRNLLGNSTTLKLRASWGLTGNNNIGNYKYEQDQTGSGGTIIGSTVYNGSWAGNITDSKLGWESTSQYNFGFDLSLLRNRLSIIGNYYNSKSYNLLFNQNISSLSGSQSILTNLKNSDVRNTGVDLQIDAKIISSKDYSLNFSGNINANKNLVKSLGGASQILVAGAERSYTTHVTRVGQPIGMFYGIKVAGMVRQSDMANIAADRAVYLANNNSFPKGYTLKGPPISTYSSTPLNPGDLYFKDVNGDGLVNESDKDVIGTPYPKFTYGFNLSMSYKQFDFSASFNGSYGNQVLDGQDYYIRNFEGSGNNYSVVDNRYRSESQAGDGHEYRASRAGTQSNSTRLSDFYLQDGSFFRCTNITVGMNLSNIPAVKKIGVSGVRIYAGVDNAFTITKYLGYNPEVDYNNGVNLSPGVDYGKYPLMRAINTGIKVQF
jgi:TonB-linked SusC/RagA family outer membrane protein